MERLTIKNNDGSYSQPTHTTFNKLFDKLSKFEDVLEKYGIESAGFGVKEICIFDTPKNFPQTGFQLGMFYIQRGWNGDIRFNKIK